jgi:23S rRNA pseudouridine1911/1915/1917 synthase
VPALAVLYEDGEMLVVDKPAGMHTAPLRRGEGGTLLEAVIAAHPEVASLPGLKPLEPGLVHRLDRETSGCVVVARTPAAFAALRELFAAELALKTYAAACACVEQDQAAEDLARIESRFAPYGRGRRMVRVVLPEERARRGTREATAESYRTEARIAARAPGRVLVEARITRGFRHQVRAHLAFIGLPILGDPLYGAPVPGGFAPRMYLHAVRLDLPHPATGAPLVVESPEPPELLALFGAGSVDPDAVES